MRTNLALEKMHKNKNDPKGSFFYYALAAFNFFIKRAF